MRKQNLLYIETIVLFIITSLLLIAAYDEKFLYKNQFFYDRYLVTRNILFIYSLLIFFFSILSLYSIRFQKILFVKKIFFWYRSIYEELINSLQWLSYRSDFKNAAKWIMQITLIGAAVRSYFISQPIRFDEAYTFLKFVDGSILDLFNYPLPNNHILNTLLIRISIEIFGNSIVAIRIPSLISGILTIPTVFCLTNMINGTKKNGYISAAIISIFPFSILYDTMARGYSILVLLSLCLCILIIRFIEKPSLRLSILISLIVALGIFDIPTFVFPVSGIFFWCLFSLLIKGYSIKWVIEKFIMPCAIFSFFFTGILYTPTILISNGIKTIVSNKFVRSLSWPQFLEILPRHINDTTLQIIRDIHILIIVLSIILLISGLFYYLKKKKTIEMMLLPSLIFGATVMLFLKHVIPFPRTWIYLLPFFFIVLDAGYYSILKKRYHAEKNFLFVILIFIAVVIMNKNIVYLYPDTGFFPEASCIAKILSKKIKPGDQVIARIPANVPIQFYMKQEKVLQNEKINTSKRKYIVTKPSEYTIEKIFTEIDKKNYNIQKILEIGDSQLFLADKKK